MKLSSDSKNGWINNWTVACLQVFIPPRVEMVSVLVPNIIAMALMKMCVHIHKFLLIPWARISINQHHCLFVMNCSSDLWINYDNLVLDATWKDQCKNGVL